jgi:hypothetical protein
MIPVQLPREPGNFQHSVYQPGLHALNALGQDPDQPPPNEQFWKTRHTTIAGKSRSSLDYWTRARDSLCAGYNKRCVYSCFIVEIERDSSGRIKDPQYSIDHFTPKSSAPARRAFEWNNLRWCWSVINNKKDNSVITVDPVSLPGMVVELQLSKYGDWMIVPSHGLDSGSQQQVLDAINKLGLNSVRAVVNRRNQCADDFIQNPNGYTLSEMEENQPFVFRELRRQGMI